MHTLLECGHKGLFEFIDSRRDYLDGYNKKAEIGYRIAREFKKRGIVMGAVNKLLHLGFVEPGLNKIEIKIAVENMKSPTIAEQLKFIKEGAGRCG